jgi:hypothetical protein
VSSPPAKSEAESNAHLRLAFFADSHVRLRARGGATPRNAGWSWRNGGRAAGALGERDFPLGFTVKMSWDFAGATSS